MYLPASYAFDLPGLPPLDKNNLATLGVLIGMAISQPQKLMSIGIGKIVIGTTLFSLICSIGTALTNSDTWFSGPVTIQGLRPYDIMSLFVATILNVIIPLFIGRALFNTIDDALTLLATWAKVMIPYTVLMLIEVRMSPQIHTWLYGYYPHSFAQTMRASGFRPNVFMNHGLTLAFFLLMAALSALIVHRVRKSPPKLKNSGFIYVYLMTFLVFCRSLAPFIYLIPSYFAIRFAQPRQQITIAKILVLIVFLYPTLRLQPWFPSEELLEMAEEVSPQRRQSLQFRFENEETLLISSRERPLWGWGGYGRGHTYDPFTGQDLTIIDGQWIGSLSASGYLGMLAYFVPVFGVVYVASGAIRRTRDQREKAVIGGMCMMLAIYGVNTLPNSTADFMHLFLSGSIYGIAYNMRRGRGGLEQRIPNHLGFRRHPPMPTSPT